MTPNEHEFLNKVRIAYMYYLSKCNDDQEYLNAHLLIIRLMNELGPAIQLIVDESWNKTQ